MGVGGGRMDCIRVARPQPGEHYRRMPRPHVRASALALVMSCVASSRVAAQPSSRTILAIGAHAGDVELTMGPLLTAERPRGTRVVILDLTLGERGHPTLSVERYGTQKRREATEFAAAIGAQLEVGPYHDAEIRTTRRRVDGWPQ